MSPFFPSRIPGLYGEPAAFGTTTVAVRGAAVDGHAINLVPAASLTVHLSEFFKTAQNQIDSDPGAFSFAAQGEAINAKLRRIGPQVTLLPTEEFSVARRLVAQPTEAPDALEIPDVLPGQYALQVSPRVGYLSSAVYGGVDVLHQPLLISLGGSGSPLELTLRDDGAHVDGSVEGPDTPAESAAYDNTPSFLRDRVGRHFQSPRYVYFVPTIGSAGQFREITSNIDDSFTEDQLPPGEYLALSFASEHPELSLGGPEIVSRFASYGQIFEAAPEQKLHLTLRVVPEEPEK
jgi:hypothetical protein